MSDTNAMSHTQLAPLFRPFSLKSLQLKNRIVMAPMTRSMAIDGIPGELQAAYYGRRTAGGVGLILSEGTVVERPSSRNEPGIPFFYGGAALAGWKTVIEAVHAGGGKMGPQLWHVGCQPSSSVSWEPPFPFESPSGLKGPGQAHGKRMTEEDIADTIAAFGRAAGEAKRLDFDVVELHGAHGYLIDQFFWAETNSREDLFGGATLRERTRFGVEVLKAVRAAVGPDLPVILRLSQWKLQDFTVKLAQTPDALEEWLCPLVEAGADMLHCSQRRFWEPEFPEIDGRSGLNFAGWAKKLTGAATISVGSVGLSGDAIAAFMGESSTPTGLDNLVAWLERDEFDLIAVGRALLADPQWVVKVRDERTSDLKGFSPALFAELV